MTVTALQAQNLSEEELLVLKRFLSLSAKKQERVLKLASLFAESTDPEEKDEIAATLGEVLFRKSTDVTAELLDDSNDDVDAKRKLAVHREYVAKQIALQRMKRGWTQEELAEKAGLPQSHVSRLERCVHAPSYLTLQKLADALGIDPGTLDPAFPEENDE